MNNLSNAAGKESIPQRLLMSSAVLRFGGMAAAAFLLSLSGDGGVRLPAAPALCAASSPPLSAAAFAGGLCGILVSGALGERLVDVCAMLTVMIVKFILTDVLGKRCQPAMNLITSLLSYIISGTAVSLIIGGLSGGGFIAILFQGTLCAASAYAFSTAYSAFSGRRITSLTEAEAGSMGAVCLLLLGALTTLHIGTFSIGRTVGLCAVMLLSRRMRGGSFCMAGVLTLGGCAIFAPSDGLAASAAVVVSCVIACSFFRRARLAPFILAAILYLLTATLLRLPVGWEICAAELTAAGLLAYLVPDGLLQAGGRLLSHETDIMSQLASARLDYCSAAVADVRRKVCAVAEIMERTQSDAEGLILELSDVICSHCKAECGCWENNFDNSYVSFLELKTAADDACGRLTADTLPSAFSACCHRRELAAAANRFYSLSVYRREADERVRPLRELFCEQLTATQGLLSSLSRHSLDASRADGELSSAAGRILLSEGAQQLRCGVAPRDDGRLFAEAYFTLPERSGGSLFCSPEKLSSQLSDVLGCVMNIPSMSSCGGVVRMTAQEHGRRFVDYAAAAGAGGTEQSGDRTEVFTDPSGRQCFLISDGMGSGSRARLDSTMTAALLSELISAGTGAEAAIRLVSAALHVRSGEERFASVDLVCIDPSDGRTEIYKSGAARTYVKNGGEVRIIEAASPPAGITVGGAADCPARISLNLRGGDVLLMLSDGAQESAETDIKLMLMKPIKSLDKTAAEILECARRGSVHPDDISVILVTVSE